MTARNDVLAQATSKSMNFPIKIRLYAVVALHFLLM